jgi:hypothetical protein
VGVGVESQWGAMLMNKDDMLILIAPKYHIHLKTRMPLPLFGIGSHKAVHIDKKACFGY